MAEPKKYLKIGRAAFDTNIYLIKNNKSIFCSTAQHAREDMEAPKRPPCEIIHLAKSQNYSHLQPTIYQIIEKHNRVIRHKKENQAFICHFF